jgi:Nif-specific regulatory protein
MMRLEAVDGNSRGEIFELLGESCTIGRSLDSQVRLEDAHVSARHAHIVLGLNEATLCDLGSTNGTAVVRAGERIGLVGADRVALRDGDLIELGSDDDVCRLRVCLAEDPTAAELVSIKTVAELDSAVTSLQNDPITLRALYAAQSRIGRATDLGAQLEAIAQAVFELVARATHVTVVLRDDSSDAKKTAPPNYLPVLTRARPHSEAPGSGDHFVPITRSVYRKVLRERAAILAADAPQILGQTASIMGASLRSCIAVPLWRGDEVFGVLQVDNRTSPGALNEGDLDTVSVIAEHASLAIAKSWLIQRLQLAEERLRHENSFLKGREERRRGGGAKVRTEVTIVGASEAMSALHHQLGKVVDTNVTVLIEGETGSGKELIAAALHYRSRRRDKLFVAQNCAALAETLLESELFGHKRGSFTGASEDKKGLFELADGSTLFLDEITEAPMSIQAKLLRALQEGEIRPVGATESKRVSVRVVAATNRNLEAEVKAGRFREDLYYRLKVFPLRVPPLRERRSDIPLLLQHFLENYAREIGKAVPTILPEAIHVLVAYDWPGNVRELQNEVQRMVIEVDPGDDVTTDLLSPRMRRDVDLIRRAGATRRGLRDTLSTVEKHLVLEALREHGGNKTSAAKALGITREGLHKKLRGFAE